MIHLGGCSQDKAKGKARLCSDGDVDLVMPAGGSGIDETLPRGVRANKEAAWKLAPSHPNMNAVVGQYPRSGKSRQSNFRRPSARRRPLWRHLGGV